MITRRGQPVAVLRSLAPEQAWKEFDGLWKRLREAARKAGYGPRSVNKLVAAVRKVS